MTTRVKSQNVTQRPGTSTHIDVNCVGEWGQDKCLMYWKATTIDNRVCQHV